MKKILLFIYISLVSLLNSQTYIKDLGIANANDGITNITKSENGFFIAGYYNRSAYIAEIDYAGNVLWKDIYRITEQKDLITDLKYINGKLIACGYGYYEGTGNFLEFYFKYDIKTKSFDWIKKSKLTLKPSNVHILPNGNILMTGDEIMVDIFKIFLMEINFKNGKMEYYTSWVFTGNESASTSTIYKDKIYLGGRYALEKKLDKYRGAISKFDLNFNEIWSNYYLNEKEKYVRNYLTKLIIDENKILSIFATNNHGITNYYTVSFSQQDLDGEILWAKEYKFENYENIRIRDIKASKHAYYLFGLTVSPTENLFLVKTDKEGTVIWAKTYGENYSDNIYTDQGNFLEITDDNIYIVAQSKSINKGKYFNSILIKLNLDGTSDKECWGTDEEIQTIIFKDLVQEGISLRANDSLFINNNLSFKKETKINSFQNSYYCYPKLAINDFDTIKNRKTIFIDFQKNDIIPVDEDVKFSIISKASNADVSIENNKITYAQKIYNACVIDSFQYEISSSLGKDSAKVYVYTIKENQNLTIDTLMPLNNILVLDAGKNDTKAKYFWSTKETSSSIKIKKHGTYTVNILKNNCLYKTNYNVLENPYFFEDIAYSNITFMLDVSISMNRENRLPVLKRALYKFLSFMRNEDKISIVNYSNKAEIIFDGISANEIDTIKEKIDNIEINGYSDIKEGIKLAIKTINNNATKSTNNRIIFTTDGDISKEKLEGMIYYIQKKLPENITFSIFLFNNSSLYKERMKSINENLYVITQENIEEVLLKEFKTKKIER